MSKLLSDEELYEKLEEMHYKLENTQHTNWDEYTNTLSGFTDLINTQKRLFAEKYVEDFYFLLDGDIQMVLEDGVVVDGRKLLRNMRSVADSLTEQRARISR